MPRASAEDRKFKFSPEAQLVGFPFARIVSGRRSFWSVHSTGNEHADFKLGELYALAFLKHLREETADLKPRIKEDPLGFLREEDRFVYLSMIVEDMVRAGRVECGIRDGFLATIERFAMHTVRPKCRIVNIIELDEHDWPWFEERALEISKAVGEPT